VSRSVISGNARQGFEVFDESTAKVEDSLITGTVVSEEGPYDVAVAAAFGSSLTLRHVSVVGNAYAGVGAANDSALIMERCLVEGTTGVGEEFIGRGVRVRENSQAMITACAIINNDEAGIAASDSSLVVDSTLIEGNRKLGVHASASDPVLTNLVVRDTRMDSGHEYGRGINIESSHAALVERCVVSDSHEFGISLGCTTGGIVSDCLVTGTRANAEGLGGFGVALWDNSEGTIEGSVVTDNMQAGFGVGTSQVVIIDSVSQYTKPDQEGFGGCGCYVVSSQPVQVVNCTFRHNSQAGLQFGDSAGGVRNSLIRGVSSSKGEFLVDEVGVQVLEECADGVVATDTTWKVAIESNLIEECGRAGALFLGAYGTFIDNTVSGTRFGLVVQESQVEEAGTSFLDNEYDGNPDPESPLYVDNVPLEIPGVAQLND